MKVEIITFQLILCIGSFIYCWLLDKQLHNYIRCIRVITKLSNTEHSSKGKGKIDKSANRQNQSTTENWENRNGPDLVQAFPKKWWVESDFTAPNFPLPLRLKGSVVTITAFLTILGQIRYNSSQRSTL